MARGGFTVHVRMTGVRETLRAFDNLPKNATVELRTETVKVAETLAQKIRAAGNAEGRQAAAVADTVKVRRDRVPTIIAGPDPRTFGSEFGMNRRSGWYGRPRYRSSRPRQYKPHRGAASYWFFKTVDRNSAAIDRAWRKVADRIVAKWASGG